MRIAITGARGFVGGHLARQLAAAGHEVLEMGRGVEPPGIRYSLEEGIAPQRLHGVDLLLHCAHDFRAADAAQAYRRNVLGSIALFRAAHAAGVPRLVFISTMSAFPGCRSRYGQGKLEVEQAVTELGGYSLRLGLVQDDSGRGLSGSLRRLAAALPVIPLPGRGGQRLYPVPASELAAAVLAITKQAAPGVFTVAHDEGFTMAELLRGYAAQAGRQVVLLPLPWQLMWLGLRLAEAAGLRLSFRSDSLLSLVNQNPAPDFDSVRRLGLTLAVPQELPRSSA